MPPSVSIPEKTLEHWSSQYLAYRYHSHAALWWPSRGEDIDVRLLPAMPGKAIQIELKTTTVSGTNFHDVLVDLGQLWEYYRRPLGHQPFYAFPRPDWRGDLAAAALVEGRHVTELAFRRSGPGWWFADWMTVLPTSAVARVLRQDLERHGSPRRGKKSRLVRFDLRKSTSNPTVVWGSGAATPPTVGWRTFWQELEQCGRAGWPQLIRIPATFIRPRVAYRQSDLIGLMREAAYTGAFNEWSDDSELVTLEPTEQRVYQIGSDSNLGLAEPQSDGADETADHRQVVFVEAGALFGGVRRNRAR
ncbi:hypothetical protein [Micromonospora vulcania]|uniref:Uncharacterized protein n=1 Tax=Micromonospora vulcania TaxID=1441873 RepID=A0ABW1H7A3_9ACTN